MTHFHDITNHSLNIKYEGPSFGDMLYGDDLGYRRKTN